MNIFYLSKSPQECAQFLHDVHLRKMPTETAQLLCTTLNLLGYTSPYQSTHINHPCRKWSSTRGNFEWLCLLGLHLCEEYHFRTGKIHGAFSKIQFATQHAELVLPGEFTEPPQCMPEQFRGPDTVEAYRAYYKTKTHMKDGRRMDYWTKRLRPEWFDET